MDVQDVVDRLRDSYSVQRVFGQPIEKDGVTLIPVARVRGGGGGGGGEGPSGEGKGSGAGFGLNATAAGAYVVQSGQVRWQPAVDVNRLLTGAQWLLAAALLTFGRIWLARGKGVRRRAFLHRHA